MRYRMFVRSLQGPKYIKKGWVCQDSSGKWETDSMQIIAIADGHGSSDCFRSEYGSVAAVQTAYLQTELYCSDGKMESDDGLETIHFSEAGIAKFKYSIWTKWRELVKSNWDDLLSKQQTLGEGELRYESVSQKYIARYTAEDEAVVDHYLYTAYGTTLLFALVVKGMLLLMQIGDGTCVILQRNGEFRTPIPPDEDNFLNVTTSLCEDDANLKIRHAIIDCDDDSPTMPVAVFLSSDGIDDCYPIYRNEQHLYKLYTIIIENILNEGFENTETEIVESLLPGMSAAGSQDDVSLAFCMSNDLAILEEAYNLISEAYKSPVEKAVSTSSIDSVSRKEGQAATHVHTAEVDIETKQEQEHT